ncbi:hypothetical protein ACQCT3_06635 [Sutcliffiella horikoshii]|uniref:hypothetical protein n=1 Tax=Sutcliffiella horikoshii TaxID=79883 RepID=UPI003CEB3675
MINKENISRDLWPSVNIECLSERDKDIFLNRKYAVDAYIENNKSVKEICKTSGIARSELYRLIGRCLETNVKGVPYGYTALIPYKRTIEYKRKQTIDGFKDDKNLTGAFNKFLKIYPQLEELIIDLVFPNKRRGPQSSVLRVKEIHKKFIQECRKLDISPDNGDYPFNTEDYAKRSLYRYIDNLKSKNPSKTISSYGSNAKMLYNNTGIGESPKNIERPFERVEFDGHKIDVSLAIKYTTLEGDEVVETIDRIWLLAIRDCATRVVLGYHICLAKEYSALDVLLCIKKSILPHKSPNFTIPGLNAPVKGYHSQVIPETKFAVWGEISMDNAKANLAKIVKDICKKIIGCGVNAGPVATPTRRPIIEKFFDLLEENGFHRLTNTTGSKPSDPRRKDSENEAKKYEITPYEIEQLVEILIAQENNRPSKGLNSLTPLEAMRQRINRMMPFKTLEEEYRDGKELTSQYDTRTVRGKITDGRRPYIHYLGVDYRNEILADSFHLVNTMLSLKIDTEDLRFITAFLPDGSELGILTANGKWGIRKHSLKLRKVINNLIKKGEIRLAFDDDPLDFYHDYLREKGAKNKNSRNQIAQMQSHQRENPNDQTNFVVNSQINLTDEQSNQRKKKKRPAERYFFNS